MPSIAPSELFVFQIGTTVSFGNASDNITGIVIGVSIGESFQIQYQVAWWSGRERKTEWLTEREVAAAVLPALKIGFLSAKNAE